MLEQGIVYLVARLLPAIVNFVALGLYAHYLTPAQYGQYTLLLLSAMFLVTGVFNLFSMALLRFHAEAQEHHREASLLATVWWSYVMLSLLLMCLAVLVDRVWHQPLLVLVITLAVLQGGFQLSLQWLVVHFQAKRYAFASGANAVLCIVLAYALLRLGYGFKGILFSLWLANLISLAWLYWYCWRQHSWRNWSRPFFKQVLAYGGMVSVCSILNYLIFASDRLMLAYLKGNAAVGRYSLAYTLTLQTLTVLFMALQLYYYPRVLKLYEHDTNQARAYLQKSGEVLFALVLPAGLGLMLIAAPLARIYAAPAYYQALVNLMPWVSLMTLCAGFKSYYFDLAYQIGKQLRLQLVLGLIVWLVNIAGNLLFIPRYDYIGAAWAALLAYAVGMGLSYHFSRYAFQIKWPFCGSNSGKTVLACAVMVSVVMLVHAASPWEAVLLKIGLGAAAYGLVLVGCNAFKLRQGWRWR